MNTKELQISDEVRDYLKIVTQCCDKNLYEAALILSQVKLEEFMRRIIRFGLRKFRRVSSTVIDEYYNRKHPNISYQMNILFQEAYLSYPVNMGHKDKIHYKALKKNFLQKGRKIRNKIVHTGKSQSIKFMVVLIKNNIYLIDVLSRNMKIQYKWNGISDLRIEKGILKPIVKSPIHLENIIEKPNNQKKRQHVSFSQITESIENYEGEKR